MIHLMGFTLFTTKNEPLTQENAKWKELGLYAASLASDPVELGRDQGVLLPDDR